VRRAHAFFPVQADSCERANSSAATQRDLARIAKPLPVYAPTAESDPRSTPAIATSPSRPLRTCCCGSKNADLRSFFNELLCTQKCTQIVLLGF
jgi:hypothetical protein